MMRLMMKRGLARAVGVGMLGLLAMMGCAGRVRLEERPVVDLIRTEELARHRVAYERARGRVDGIERGMSVAEVEETMDAIVAIEQREGADGEVIERRQTVVEGLLCMVNPSARVRRWLFGYDQDRVILVGFAIEFEREDPEEEAWVVRRVDGAPADDCGGIGRM
jgi:hypothetical protein